MTTSIIITKHEHEHEDIDAEIDIGSVEFVLD
jgi:hypothetical protein